MAETIDIRIAAQEQARQVVQSVNAELRQLAGQNVQQAQVTKQLAGTVTQATAAYRNHLLTLEQYRAIVQRTGAEAAQLGLRQGALADTLARAEGGLLRTGRATTIAGIGVMQLRQNMASAVAMAAGFNRGLLGIVSRLALLAGSAPVMLGVLAGLGALAAVIRRLTRASREQREADEKLLAGFDEQSKAIERLNAVRREQLRLAREVRREQELAPEIAAFEGQREIEFGLPPGTLAAGRERGRERRADELRRQAADALAEERLKEIALFHDLLDVGQLTNAQRRRARDVEQDLQGILAMGLLSREREVEILRALRGEFTTLLPVMEQTRRLLAEVQVPEGERITGIPPLRGPTGRISLPEARPPTLEEALAADQERFMERMRATFHEMVFGAEEVHDAGMRSGMALAQVKAALADARISADAFTIASAEVQRLFDAGEISADELTEALARLREALGLTANATDDAARAQLEAARTISAIAGMVAGAIGALRQESTVGKVGGLLSIAGGALSFVNPVAGAIVGGLGQVVSALAPRDRRVEIDSYSPRAIRQMSEAIEGPLSVLNQLMLSGGPNVPDELLAQWEWERLRRERLGLRTYTPGSNLPRGG